jgi:hypothetical protein
VERERGIGEAVVAATAAVPDGQRNSGTSPQMRITRVAGFPLFRENRPDVVKLIGTRVALVA